MLLNFLQERTIGNHDDLSSQDRVVMIFLNSYFHIQHLKNAFLDLIMRVREWNIFLGNFLSEQNPKDLALLFMKHYETVQQYSKYIYFYII